LKLAVVETVNILLLFPRCDERRGRIENSYQ